MDYENFIINYLVKEKKESIKMLMSTNLSGNFSLSTDIPEKIDIEIEKNAQLDEDIKEFDEKMNKKLRKL